MTHVSITPVPVDRTPAPLPTPLPNQPLIRPTMVFTSQPGNACVWNAAANQCFTDDTGPKMPVIYPNLSGANPGARVELWGFNHNTVQWYQYGMGTVSADGKQIDPDAGVGLRDFSWHFPSPPSRDGNQGDPGGSCPSTRGNNPVEFTTGVKIETMTDISFDGARGGLELTRTYTSDQAFGYGGSFGLNNIYRFGIGTRDNYDIRLIGSFAANSTGSGYLVTPEQTPFFAVGNQVMNGGRLFSYDDALSQSGTTTFTNRTTTGLLGDTIRRIDSQTLEYRSTRGYILRFEPNPASVPTGYTSSQHYRLKSVIDRNGNTTTLTYSGNNLTQVTDAVGRTLTFSYNAPTCAGCVSQVVAGKSGDPLQRIASYTYDNNGLLIKVTDQLGKEYQYAYSGASGSLGANHLTQVTDRRGNVVKKIAYDTNNRVISQTFADGGTERYNYTLSGDLVTGVTIIDPLGRTLTKRFNAQGYVIEESDALGQVSVITRTIGTNTASKTTGPCGCLEAERTFDTYGNVTSIKDKLVQTESWQYRQFNPAHSYDPLLDQVTSYTDKRGKTTGYGYDAVSPNSLLPKGNLTTITNPMQPPEITTYGYAPNGQLTGITDALNHTTTIDYDVNGFANKQTDALNHATTFQYDWVGNLLLVTDALSRKTRMRYDDLDRVFEVRNPVHDPVGLTGNPTYSYTYDENGNRRSVTDANLKTWTFTYDAKNRQLTGKRPLPDPNDKPYRMEYDTADQLLKAISPTGRTMRYAYDERGQQKIVTDSLGNNVTFGYDNRGNLTTLKDQRGNTTTFGYDELFRLTGRRDPLGRLVTVEYDPAGNVKTQTDRMGRRTTIVYDNINRPETVTYVDATVTYQYDAAGRWKQVSDASGTIIWGYDNANRVTSETTNLGVVSYGYNDANQRTSMTAATRPPVSYGYDGFGRLETISQTLNGVAEVFTYGYDTLSRRQQLQRQANGTGIVTTNYEYDEISRLKRLKHTRVSTGTLHEDFQYEYSLEDEITKITSLASAPLTSQSKTATAADAANRIGQFGAASYTFNQEGQTTSKTEASGTTGYQWDARGRLGQATLPGGQTVSHGYDALGRRINRATSGLTTTFQYDGADVVVDRVSDGSFYDYINGMGIDDKLRQSGGAWGSLFILQDHLGGTRGLAAGTGGLVESLQQYEAFGSSGGSVRTRYGFTGRERDDLTGLMYYRARWYDPSQGRFKSEDPISFEGGLNLFRYVKNSPLGMIDPLGLRPCPEILSDIRSTLAELKTRAYESEEDIHGLQWNHWSKFTPHPDYGSVEGHKEQYEGKQRRLISLLREWRETCLSRKGGGPRPPTDCKQWIKIPFPFPKPKTKPVKREMRWPEFEDAFDNMANPFGVMPLNPLVPLSPGSPVTIRPTIPIRPVLVW